MAKLLVRCLISARNTVIASEIICRLGYFAIYLEVNCAAVYISGHGTGQCTGQGSNLRWCKCQDQE